MTAEDGGLALTDPARPSRICRITGAATDPAFMNFALHRVLGEVVSGSNEIPPGCSTDIVGTTDVLLVFSVAGSPADLGTVIKATDAVRGNVFRIAGHVNVSDWQDFMKQRQATRTQSTHE